MNTEQLQPILTQLRAGYRLYHRHQEEELKIEYHAEEEQFVVTEAVFMGACSTQLFNAEALCTFLSKRFSSISSIERRLLPKQQ